MLAAGAATDRASHGRRSIVPAEALRALCHEVEPTPQPADRIHRLKTDPEVFEEVASGRKPFELRRADRDYQVGDVLELHEYDRSRGDRSRQPDPGYSGRVCVRLITFMLGQRVRGPGAAYAQVIDHDHVILGLTEP